MKYMDRLCRHVHSFFSNEEGATAVEFAIMAGFIAAVIAATVENLGIKVIGLFESLKF